MVNKNSIKKGQASMEYMAIFGIGFLLVAMIGGLFFSYTNSAKKTLDVDQVNKIGTELIDDIQKIYFFGDSNRRTYKTTFPKGIENFTIHHVNESGLVYNYLNITLLNDDFYNSLIFQTSEDYINIECLKTCIKTSAGGDNFISSFDYQYLGQGFKNIRIEAINGSVFIDFNE